MLPTFENLRNLSAADIEQLIRDSVPEDTQLDYKRALYDESKLSRDWCKDISAMANADGGCLVFGVEEVEGVPVDAPGIDGDPDKLINRLDQVAQANIRPRLQILYKPLDLATGKRVLLAATPRSRYGPHMVVAGDDWRFYRRTHRDTVRMDVDDLRRSFTTSRSMEERILELHRHHVQHSRKSTVLDLVYVIDFFPVPPEIERLDFGDEAAMRAMRDFHPFASSAWDFRISFDAFVLFRTGQWEFETRISRSASVYGAYRQPSNTQYGKIIGSLEIARQLDAHFKSVRNLHSALACRVPVFACLTMLNTHGCSLGIGSFPESTTIDHEELEFPPVLISSDESDNLNIVGPWMHRLWNAAGLPRCHFYDPKAGLVDRSRIR